MLPRLSRELDLTGSRKSDPGRAARRDPRLIGQPAPMRRQIGGSGGELRSFTYVIEASFG
jgi:hypothetical protein